MDILTLRDKWLFDPKVAARLLGAMISDTVERCAVVL